MTLQSVDSGWDHVGCEQGWIITHNGERKPSWFQHNESRRHNPGEQKATDTPAITFIVCVNCSHSLSRKNVKQTNKKLSPKFLAKKCVLFLLMHLFLPTESDMKSSVQAQVLSILNQPLFIKV